MKLLHLTIILTLFFEAGFAQQNAKKQRIKVDPPVCYASEEVEKGYIPPPTEIFNKLKSGEIPTADIRVNYSLFPQEAKDAFEFAVSVWEYLIDSPITIYMQANWRSMGGNVLGSSGPSEYIKNFKNAPQKDIFYPIAVAEKLTGTEIYDENIADIEAQFNKNVDWYFGIDGKTPDSLYDFVSVVMHEIGHGLGITGFFFVESVNGAYAYEDYGDAAAFDLLVMDVNNRLLLDQDFFPNQSATLKNALVSNGLFANSPAGKKLGGGYKPRLYAPQIWDNGSSVYHLNDATYPHTNENSLMTHTIGKGEAVHDPGPIVEGIMADLGWKHLYIDHQPVKDKEELQPLTFNANLRSDYPLDTSKLFVVYSVDEFQSNVDSAALIPQADEGLFSVEIPNKKNWQKVSYFLKTGDQMDRIFNFPSDVPQSYFTVNFGPDNSKPEIIHEEISYYLLSEDDLKIYAYVDDNLGVDTVYVTYAINDGAQESFGLTRDSLATLYSGYFNFDKSVLNDGDEISYNIIAQDASVAQNKMSAPFKDKFIFKIEKLFDPVFQYANNFNAETSDFLLSDFEILTEDGFFDGALHSPHPYPAPEENNAEFNFSTILKYPIILGESGMLSFDEVVLVEPGTTGTEFGDFEFWDFVIVEGSKDEGKTWQPLSDGYDSRANFNWNNIYNESIVEQNSTATGSAELFVTRNIDLLDNEYFSKGDTILIRFRLFSDPYAYGWGWAIDNVLIEQVVAARTTVLSPGNIRFYPNPVNQKLNIDLRTDHVIEDLQIAVYNMYGQKMQTIRKNNFSGILAEQIDFGGFENGMYLISVRENGKQVFADKIVKNK